MKRDRFHYFYNLVPGPYFSIGVGRLIFSRVGEIAWITRGNFFCDDIFTDYPAKSISTKLKNASFPMTPWEGGFGQFVKETPALHRAENKARTLSALIDGMLLTVTRDLFLICLNHSKPSLKNTTQKTVAF